MSDNQPEPQWPVVVFESGTIHGVYTREEWYGDADLCSAGTWDDSAFMVDSGGTIFHIKFTILKKGRLLWVIPCDEVTNKLIQAGRITPEEFVSKVAGALWESAEYLGFVKSTSPERVIPESIKHLGGL